MADMQFEEEQHQVSPSVYFSKTPEGILMRLGIAKNKSQARYLLVLLVILLLLVTFFIVRSTLKAKTFHGYIFPQKLANQLPDNIKRNILHAKK